MLVKDVIDFLDSYAPLKYSEDFDNTGLIVGDINAKLTGIIICLDSTKEVIQEAIDSNSNLIISFHPIIFNGLKQLSPGNYVNDSIILAIKNNISIFVCILMFMPQSSRERVHPGNNQARWLLSHGVV